MPDQLSIYFDGRWLKAGKAFLESLSPGIFPHRGAFETLRAYDGRLFACAQHLERLRRGLRHLKIHTPVSSFRLHTLITKTLKINRLTQARVRVTVWKESGAVKLSIVCTPLTRHQQQERGYHLAVSERIKPVKQSSAFKLLDYALNALAFQEAASTEFDEALFLNPRHEIVEGTRSNIFFVKDKRLYTPALACGCLKGITRSVVLGMAKASRWPCKIGAFPLKVVLNADEVFLTNSVIEIMPVVKIEDRIIASGKRGPLTAQLSQAYKELVSKKTPAFHFNL